MQQLPPFQTNFTAGELTPWLNGRFDTEKYANGATTLLNGHVRVHGGFSRRSGTSLLRHSLQNNSSVHGLFSFDVPGQLGFDIHYYKSNDGSWKIDVSQGEYVVATLQSVPPLGQHNHSFQRGDILYIMSWSYTTGDHEPLIVFRSNAGWDWLYLCAAVKNGPYEEQQGDDWDVSMTLGSISSEARATSDANVFSTCIVGNYFEYFSSGQRVLGVITNKISDYEVLFTPLDSLCTTLSTEVHAAGEYTGWNNTTNTPTYAAITSGTTTVAFSRTAVVTRDIIQTYLRFMEAGGTFWWMNVTGTGNIIQNGSYGILATGTIIVPTVSLNNITVTDRKITATLTSSELVFAPGHAEATVNGRTRPGRWVRLGFTDCVINAVITSVTQVGGNIWNSQATVRLSQLPPKDQGTVVYENNGTTYNWRLGCFHGTSGTGTPNVPYAHHCRNNQSWPCYGVFHESRLWVTGAGQFPQLVAGSRSEDYYSFATADDEGKVLDDSAIVTYLPVPGRIMWLSSNKQLLYATDSCEGSIFSGDWRQSLSPTNFNSKILSRNGSSPVAPAEVGNVTVYALIGGQRVRQIQYDDRSDTFVSRDISLFSEHIFRVNRRAVSQLVVQRFPFQILWVLFSDGTIASMTYEPDHEVYAWSRHQLGGNTPNVFRLSTSYYWPNYGGPLAQSARAPVQSLVLLVVRGSKTTTEVFEPLFEPSSATDHGAMRFLDCARFRVFFPTTGVTQIVDTAYSMLQATVIIDSKKVFAIQFDAFGVAHLPETCRDSVYYGMPYQTIGTTLPPSVHPYNIRGSQVRRIDHVTARVADTINMQYGSDPNDLQTYVTRRQDDPVDSLTPIRSLDIKVPLNMGHSLTPTLTFGQNGPYPLTVLCLFPDLIA